MDYALKIVFVCIGNTCRSPIAEFVAKKALKDKGIKNVCVLSRGVFVTEKSINPLSKQILDSKKLNIGNFRPKKLTKATAKNCDALIAMTDEIKNLLIEKGYDRVYSTDELVGYDIPDPYGKGFDDYIECEDTIEAFVVEIVEMIEKILNGKVVDRGVI